MIDRFYGWCFSLPTVPRMIAGFLSTFAIAFTMYLLFWVVMRLVSDVSWAGGIGGAIGTGLGTALGTLRAFRKLWPHSSTVKPSASCRSGSHHPAGSPASPRPSSTGSKST